jgi:death on curing protein
MKEPDWIARDEALAIHDMMLAQHGGLAGLRDEGMLDSALKRPRQLHAYGKPDLHDLAAGYAKAIIQNHPFGDGNKRTGFLLAAVFLEVNGWTLRASEDSVVEYTLGLAARTVSEEKYAAWLRTNSQRTG